MKNTDLSTKIDDVRKQLLSIKANSSHKLNIITRVEENIRTDLLEIKSYMKFLSDSVTALVTSSMDQILDMFKERGESKCTGAAYNQEKKRKGKNVPNVQTFDPMNLKPPSFDLGISYTQPTPNVPNKPDMPQTHQLQEKIDTIRSHVVMDAEVAEQKQMDSCFYYIRQLALYGENVKYKATTTDSYFKAVIKHVYPLLKKDPNVLLIDTRLINDVTGVRLPLSCPWPEVDRVLMPILPTNKAHWMLVVLAIKKCTTSIFNSARWTYPDLHVHASLEPFVRVIPHLMRAIGLWNKDPDNHEGDSMKLKIVLGYNVPQ
ncbi:sentrin-specific protease 1-like [Olea europaea subsp. europaea]|uniref:Sentrin-specific protease 1-like n=1 Tax=Olea europaea subsp. europaea TaxID=158383 RepID=A0A8S0S4L1_OLEEU|nr:sentrin-specific protease 1-like [Olea europaea subsp. europaea]